MLLSDIVSWALASPTNVGLTFIIIGLVLAVLGVVLALWLDSVRIGEFIIRIFGYTAIACIIVGCADLLMIAVYGLIT